MKLMAFDHAKTFKRNNGKIAFNNKKAAAILKLLPPFYCFTAHLDSVYANQSAQLFG